MRIYAMLTRNVTAAVRTAIPLNLMTLYVGLPFDDAV
jgi:hypothetical protein